MAVVDASAITSPTTAAVLPAAPVSPVPAAVQALTIPATVRRAVAGIATESTADMTVEAYVRAQWDAQIHALVQVHVAIAVVLCCRRTGAAFPVLLVSSTHLSPALHNHHSHMQAAEARLEMFTRAAAETRGQIAALCP